MSTAPSTIVDHVINIWRMLSDTLKKTILKELEEEFVRDDQFRAKSQDQQLAGSPLGWDCDRATWDRLRQFMKTKLTEETESTVRPC